MPTKAEIVRANRIRHAQETRAMLEGLDDETMAIALEIGVMLVDLRGFLHGVATERLAEKQAEAKE